MEEHAPNESNGNLLFTLGSATLKGISQVIFIENAVTGLLVLIAIFLASVPVGIIALLSSLIGACIGWFGGMDKTIVRQGLMGFNPALAGIAIAINLTGGYRWPIALAGAVITAFVTAAMMHFMRNAGIPVFTFPYIVVSWFVLLASYRLGSIRLNPTLVPQDLSNWKLHQEGTFNWISGLVRGIGQVYFQGGFWSGVIILAGVVWGGRKIGLFTVIGSAIACLTVYGLSGEITLLNAGLYGYNAVLTILAVGVVFDAGSRMAQVTGIIAAIVSVPVTASIDSWLLPYGLPAFTFPFVLCAWVFLAARKVVPRI
ncbi:MULTISPECIES: urea transporter [Paenibacillus]|uniref:Urea transporter n=1 Tax=Paenibacillus albilobatus TaxID=2716884 RepID=A0A920C8M7_9BACL|nr:MULTISPECIES: urea transporter [Paenibacillus]GIO30100.1 hypothetical protein J2TS6_12410 [Paenibacillus albilobatus]